MGQLARDNVTAVPSERPIVITPSLMMWPLQTRSAW